MADKATSYRYYPLHQDVICDETAIDELPPTVDDLGCGRVMITCGPTILQSCNTVPRVQEALGHRYAGTHRWSGSPSFPACGSHSDHPGQQESTTVVPGLGGQRELQDWAVAGSPQDCTEIINRSHEEDSVD